MTRKVLIVDSDHAQGFAFKAAAKSEGFDPIWFKDGDDAIRYLEEEECPRLVITALSPAGTDGFEVLATLRRRAEVEDTPALVSSSYASLRDKAWRQREDLGVSEIVERPASEEICKAAIRRALGAPKIVGRPGSLRPPVLTPLPAIEDAHAALLDIVKEACAEFERTVVLMLLAEGGMTVAGGGPYRALATWPPVHEVLHAASPLCATSRSHPLLADDPIGRELDIGSFAMVPLLSGRGRPLGVLALVDEGEFRMGPRMLGRLVEASRRIAGEVELAVASTRRKNEAARLVHQLDDVADVAARAAVTAMRLSAIVENLEDGVLLFDADRRLRVVNPVAKRLLRAPPGGWTAATFADVISAQIARAADPSHLQAALRIPAVGLFAFHEELELARPSRVVLRWTARPIRSDDEDLILSTVRDVTAATDLLREKASLALVDPLTGLGNRRAAEEAVLVEIARTERFSTKLSLAIVDVDHFKTINDTAGHATGDRVLETVAAALRETSRRTDLAFRWGGDEFLVLLPDEELAGARGYAERLAATVTAARTPGWAEPVGVSIGVAEVDEDFAPAFEAADAELRRRKQR